MRPRTTTRPSSGGSVPRMTRHSVDFPAPLRPITASTEPFLTSKDDVPQRGDQPTAGVAATEQPPDVVEHAVGVDLDVVRRRDVVDLDRGRRRRGGASALVRVVRACSPPACRPPPSSAPAADPGSPAPAPARPARRSRTRSATSGSIETTRFSRRSGRWPAARMTTRTSTSGGRFASRVMVCSSFRIPLTSRGSSGSGGPPSACRAPCPRPRPGRRTRGATGWSRRPRGRSRRATPRPTGSIDARRDRPEDELHHVFDVLLGNRDHHVRHRRSILCCRSQEGYMTRLCGFPAAPGRNSAHGILPRPARSNRSGPAVRTARRRPDRDPSRRASRPARPAPTGATSGSGPWRGSRR